MYIAKENLFNWSYKIIFLIIIAFLVLQFYRIANCIQDYVYTSLR
jgi:hypothetical protein